jgi:hypothetical protein
MAGILTAAVASTFSGVTPDPYFEYTTLLLPGSGTNGTQNNSFVDSSANAFPITRNPLTGPNAPTQGTFSPFSQTGWGNYFDGSGDYLTTPDNAAYTVGSGNWTLEAWVYPTASPNQPIIVGQWSGGSDGSICMILSNDGNRYLRGLVYSGGTVDRISGSSLQLNAWNHCAFVREGTFLNLYLNGSRVDNYSFGSGSIQDSSLVMSIGAGSGGIVPFQGYISNCRFLKGTAQYTGATYTVPTAPLTAITNTQLLTCQSNRFKDNSTNNFTITVNGNTSVQAFSPFNPTASWSAATYGGSGYFDGSGDYLTVPDNAAFTLGNSDFCIELWINSSPSMATYAGFFGQWANATTNCAYVFRTQASQIVQFSYTTTGNGQTGTVVNGSALTANGWNHLVVCRNGANLAIFQNGTRTATHNISTLTISDSTRDMQIGYSTDGGHVLGYMSNLRLVKGSSVYDPTQTSITVPTAPLTAITNTSLLLNFTNAGIYDATSKNDLETVGDAQISNAVTPKWGSTSIKFDGTGDYLLSNAASTDLYAFGSGNFTIEFWVYFTNTTGDGIIYDSRGVEGAYPTIYRSGTTIIYYTNSASRITSGTIAATTWYHVVVCRSGTSTKMFIDGVQAGSTYTDSTVYLNAAQRPIVGAAGVSGFVGVSPFNGYIQDLRITKGYARYTANFTPPTAAFPTL